MAAKRERGGQPGNLNSSRHPHRSYLKRRVVPKRYHSVLRLGDECLAQIQSDLPEMSGKERMTAEGIKILWTCAMLGLAEAKERGFTTIKPDGSWDFQEGMKTAGGFIDKAIKGMAALGLSRRTTKEVGDLAAAIQDELRQGEEA